MALQKIDSIEELRQARSRLKVESEVALQGVKDQAEYTGKTAKKQLVSGTGTVIGVGALAALGITLFNKFLNKSDSAPHAGQAPASGNSAQAAQSLHTTAYGATPTQTPRPKRSTTSLLKEAFSTYRRYQSPESKGVSEWFPLAQMAFAHFFAKDDDRQQKATKPTVSGKKQQRQYNQIDQYSVFDNEPVPAAATVQPPSQELLASDSALI